MDEGHHNETVLLERGDELQRIGAALESVGAGEGAMVLLAGGAGMGKTSLLEAAVARAHAAGGRVLTARASELESDFAFGVVRQLVEEAVLQAGPAQRSELLSGAARHAAAVLDLDSGPATDRDLHATLHGLYWLLVNLRGEGPLVVAVDDLQWADEPSQRWLAYTARRLDRSGILLLAGVRTEGTDGRAQLGAGATDTQRAAVEEILGLPGAQRLEPGPLSAGAVSQVLSSTLGRQADAAFAAASHDRTLGNPFLVYELAAELAAEAVQPTGAATSVLERVVPQRVSQSVRGRLARLSGDARALADALAVLGDDSDTAVVCRLAGVPADHAGAFASELVAAHFLDDAPGLRFRHPLVRTAVQEGIPAIDRGRLHAQAARLLDERAAPAGRVASHLLASPARGDDEWAVERLRAAARAARAQGAPGHAVRLLGRALAEGLAPGPRVVVLRELGQVELETLVGDAGAHLHEARELCQDPAERAALALEVGFADYYAGRHADGLVALEAAAAETREQPGLREEWLRIEALLALVGRDHLQTEERTRGRIEALGATLSGATPGERMVQATARSQAPGGTAAALVRATEETVRAVEEQTWPDAPEGIGTVAMFVHAGRPELAARYAESLLEADHVAGSPMRYAIGLGARSLVFLDTGDLKAASDDLDTMYETLAEIGDRVMRTNSAGFRAMTWTEMGQLDRAEELLADHDLLGDLPERMFFNPTLFQRGTLRLAQRRFDLAEQDFRELGRRNSVWGMTRPSPPWRAAIALALIGQGDRGQAAEMAREEVRRTEAWGNPKVTAYAFRALALTAEGEESIAGLTAAVAAVEDTPWRLERARARLDLGSALRRAGTRRAAREALALAMDEAHACGAEPLAERAAEELRASGARPRRRAVTGRDALTPSELRVARLAAGGHSNRQIAEELFVTMATVETHLSRCYRKLDLGGRAGLATALASPDGSRQQ